MYEIRKYGGNGVLVEFENEINPSVHQKVLRLAELARNQPGVTTVIPAYQSLTLLFDTAKTNFSEIKSALSALPKKDIELKGKNWRIPVCYDKKFALDCNEVMKQTGLTWSEVIQHHTAHSYRVYLLGFQPGFAYLGSLPEALRVKRREQPRKQVPAQHVGLAGMQTGIYPATLPGGWQIIGSTPLPAFYGNNHQPLWSVGDQVQFYSVSLEEHERLASEIFKPERHVR